MLGLFDDITLLGKRAFAFLTGKGASISAVALASSQVPATQLPIVGLTVGLPITAAMNTMMHHYREQAITDKFAPEIADRFNIAPEEVTPDHLRSLAFGDEARGIDGNPLLREAVEHNDKNRWISVGANILAGVLTIGTIATFGADIGSAMTGAITELGLPGMIASAGLSIATAAIMVVTDRLLNTGLTRSLGNNGRTSYDRLETMQRQQQHGVDISPSQIMGLLTDMHPQIQQDIEDQYGKPFIYLREDARAAVVAQYEPAFHLHELADAINKGDISITALAFMDNMNDSSPPQPTTSRTIANHTAGHAIAYRDDFAQRFAPRDASPHMSHAQRISEERESAHSPDYNYTLH